MAHTQKNRDKIILRVRKLQGQLNGVSNSIEAEKSCYDILQNLASARGALDGLILQLMQGHIEDHIIGAENSKSAQGAAEETISILRSFWK